MSTSRFDQAYHRNNPYGSAYLGSESDAAALRQGRAAIGQLGNTILRFNPEQPAIIFGGAGSGKFANVGGYFLSHPSMSDNSFFILDLGGQYLSTSWHYNLAYRREVYALNPEGASAYPDLNHPFDLWSILKDDEHLFDNARRIAAMGLSSDAKGDNAWIGQDSRRWMLRILIALVLVEGRATPQSFWRLLNAMDSDDDVIKEWGRKTHELPYGVHTIFLEIHRDKQHAEKAYSAIMGKLKSDFDWLSSPAIADSVSGEDDIFSDFINPDKKVGIYTVLKSGSAKSNASYIRMVVGIAMLHCMRHVSGTLPSFYLEEAATCGNADFIKQAVSECRKYFHTILVYQSLGQLEQLFDKGGKQEILESCGQQLFLGGGIRDYDSALKIANTIGKTTITLDDPMMQNERAFQAEHAFRDELLRGGDPMAAAEQHQHQLNQSQQGRYTQRFVIDPAEIMRLTNDMIILSPSTGTPPILAHKLPVYWDNPNMAGRFAPDPLFPPLDRVITKNKWWGKTTRKFIREAVPEHLADMPNHSNGQVAYVEGFKTF